MTPHEIAAKMTKAQREAVLDARKRWSGGVCCIGPPATLAALRRAGLIEDGYGSHLNETGLAVRAELERMNADDR